MDRLFMASMARERAKIYDLLAGILTRLPDQEFLGMVRGDALNQILDGLSDLKSARCDSGIEYIHSYQSAIKSKSDQEVLNELSVDRTRILRGTGHPDLKPPYEGLYKDYQGVGETLLEVKRFYRNAGILPDDSVHEAGDFLGIELDFMKHLCLREQDKWKSDAEAWEMMSTEEAFLREHLGGWIGKFCRRVEKHALTDFYRGFALIVEAVVLTDMRYMRGLLETYLDCVRQVTPNRRDEIIICL
jgi:TorA maturation chaperone TorD